MDPEKLQTSRGRQIIAHAVNAKGECMFSESDLEWLMDLPSPVVTAVCELCDNVQKTTSVGDQLGNCEETRDDD